MNGVILLGVRSTVVLWLIHSSFSLQTVKVAIGQTAHLHCIVEITGPIHVEWINPLEEVLTYDEQVFTQDQRFAIRHHYVKEWTLEIANVRNGDAGRYTCRIGPYPEINHHLELIVTVPPEIRAVSGNGNYVLNSTVTLSCTATGIPEPKITWHRIENYRLIELNVEGSNYVIKSVNLLTSGVYECHAANGVLQTAKATLEVLVLFAPIIKVPGKEVLQEEGAWTQLSCLVTVNPKAELYWARNGKRIEDSSSYVTASQEIGRYQHLLRLSIETLSYSDFGEYECHAENKYGKDKGKILLSGERRKKAIVISKPRDITAVVGEDVLFNCSVLHMPADDRLIWWHRSANETKKLFEIPSLKHNSTKTPEWTASSRENAKYDIIGQYNLLVRRSNFSDEGVYVCQITGHENLSAFLDVTLIHNQSSTCQDHHQNQESFNLNTLLIVLGVVVFVLLVVTVVVIALVCRLLVRKNRKEEKPLHSDHLDAKASKIDE